MRGVYYSIMRTTHPDLVCLLFVPSLYFTFSTCTLMVTIPVPLQCTRRIIVTFIKLFRARSGVARDKYGIKLLLQIA